MVQRPDVRYVRSSDVFLAYHELGQGPLDLVFVPEFWNSIEIQWEEPSYAAFLRGLASLGRLICFDQRGTGLSDPVGLDRLPTLEVWMDDVRAVMEAVRSRRAVLITSGFGGLLGMTFAATYPEKVHALVMLHATARYASAPDYPYGTSPEFEDRVRRETEDGWGRGAFLDVVAPSRQHDDAFRDWWARYQRLGNSPGTQLRQRRMLLELDVRPILPSVRVPSLVIHRTGNRLVPVEQGRYLAAHLPGARLREIPGDDYFLWTDATETVLDELRSFLGGSPTDADQDRTLATVMFTDIVGSTERVAEIGDRAWRELLAAFRSTIRFELTRFRGIEIDTAGDGFLARFDGPARAIRCAAAIAEATAALGVQVRTGLHTGEVEAIGQQVSGLAVHIGSRVAGVAGPNEVLVSSTVKDLVAGSGIGFEDRGDHELKGVPDRWRLFAVVRPLDGPGAAGAA
jgi:pimeloyl-ACP methyl ester carboxylesterase